MARTQVAARVGICRRELIRAENVQNYGFMEIWVYEKDHHRVAGRADAADQAESGAPPAETEGHHRPAAGAGHGGLARNRSAARAQAGTLERGRTPGHAGDRGSDWRGRLVVLVDTNILAYLLIEGDRTPGVQHLFARDSNWCSE